MPGSTPSGAATRRSPASRRPPAAPAGSPAPSGKAQALRRGPRAPQALPLPDEPQGPQGPRRGRKRAPRDPVDGGKPLYWGLRSGDAGAVQRTLRYPYRQSWEALERYVQFVCAKDAAGLPIPLPVAGLEYTGAVAEVLRECNLQVKFPELARCILRHQKEACVSAEGPSDGWPRIDLGFSQQAYERRSPTGRLASAGRLEEVFLRIYAAPYPAADRHSAAERDQQFDAWLARQKALYTRPQGGLAWPAAAATDPWEPGDAVGDGFALHSERPRTSFRREPAPADDAYDVPIVAQRRMYSDGAWHTHDSLARFADTAVGRGPLRFTRVQPGLFVLRG